MVLVWEAVYILDGLLANTSDIQPDTVHADTQGQSLPVYGLATLLGFELLPRIRNWHDLIFYRPDTASRYRHIDTLFGPHAIDWHLLEAHWPDLMRTAISVREGRISSVTLLRRLRHDCRKNRLYRALRELGRVVRTQVLLRFLSEPALRETITVITNRVESFHRFATWFGFGAEEGVLASNDPIYQEKLIKVQPAGRQLLPVFHRAGSHRRRQPAPRRGLHHRGRGRGRHQPPDHSHHPPLRRLAPRPHPTRGHRGRPPHTARRRARGPPRRRHGGGTVSGIGEVCGGLRPGYAELAKRITGALAADARVQCVPVTGSLATGLADRYSDLDLAAVVTDTDAAADILATLPELVGDVAYCTALTRGPVWVFTAVTATWLRVDVLLEPRPVATRRGHPPHLVVFDRGHTAGPTPPPAPRALVEQFVRVLGLLEVVIGRGEYFVGMQGVMLLRQYLVDLFHAENGRPPAGGAKRLAHLLTDQQAGLLVAQPPLVADREQVIAGHLAAAAAFLPRARRLLEQQGEPWPAAFAAATRHHLQQTRNLGVQQLTDPEPGSENTDSRQ